MSDDTALGMLAEMERRGGLDDMYFDQRSMDFLAAEYVFSELTPEERSRVFELITMPGEDWGIDPFFVALEPRPAENGSLRAPWRKIMIVNRGTGEATFRSTTTDERYKPRKVLRYGGSWFLDNSMPDISVQPARVMLRHLRAQLAA